ncbi:MAG: DUF4870 domain-containing protein [Prevotellaceae bacterium]|jgi:uncharacterized Tic20 family protein|nr:DUF4870 domain-containing protein [Prevotellaceae bacterium]
MNYYQPHTHEQEAASNSYLMSFFVVMFGLPIPIVNLLATFIFFFANRKSTYYVRWHCTQALLSQLPLFLANTVLFWWTVRLFFGSVLLSSFYFAYLFTVVLFNVVELAATVYSAVQTRKGKQVEWYVYAPLTDLLCKP